MTTRVQDLYDQRVSKYFRRWRYLATVVLALEIPLALLLPGPLRRQINDFLDSVQLGIPGHPLPIVLFCVGLILYQLVTTAIQSRLTDADFLMHACAIRVGAVFAALVLCLIPGLAPGLRIAVVVPFIVIMIGFNNDDRLGGSTGNAQPLAAAGAVVESLRALYRRCRLR